MKQCEYAFEILPDGSRICFECDYRPERAKASQQTMKTNIIDQSVSFTLFIAGFAETIKAPTRTYAADQWAGFSRQLSDTERTEIESGGEESGIAQGREFNKLYPQSAE